MKKILMSLFVSLSPFYLSAHCQLPCGIYHDDLRFAMLDEDIETINKAITEIKNNSDGSAEDNNQLVRAVNLKDEYADEIAHTMSFYFLQQRITSEHKNFTELLNSSYKILQFSAKIKSSLDGTLVEKLSQEIANFKKLYTESK